MRLLLIGSLAIGLARADNSVPDGWVHACEAGLRRAAHAYGPRSDELESWEWRVGDDGLELHYFHLHAELDYRLRVAPTREKSHGWKIVPIEDQDLVARHLETRVSHGRMASISAAGAAGMHELASFLRVFRPALDGCLR